MKYEIKKIFNVIHLLSELIKPIEIGVKLCGYIIIPLLVNFIDFSTIKIKSQLKKRDLYHFTKHF